MICYLISALLCAAVMWVQWRRYRSGYRGLGSWLADYALHALGLVLVVARGVLPAWLSLWGDAIIVAGYAFLIRGLKAYFGRPTRGLVEWAVVALFAAAQGWFSFAAPDINARELALSAAVIVLSGRALAFFAGLGPGLRPLAGDTALVLGGFALASLGRLVMNLRAPSAGDFFAESPAVALVLVVYMSLFVGQTFALMSLLGRRVLGERESVIEEKTRAEAARRSSEEKFAKAFQSSPDAMTLSRLSDGRLIEVNESFSRISGYSREEALGGAPIDFWHDAEARKAWIEELLAKPLVRQRTLDLFGKGGRKIHAELSGGIVELEGERHLLSIVRDLADRDRADEILRVRLRLHEFAIGHDVGELMTRALDELEAMTGSGIGFYHFVDEERGVLVRQAWSTRTKAEFCRVAAGPAEYPLLEGGAWADCIRARAPVIHNDYPSLAGRKGLPEGHAPLRRTLVAPTIHGGKIVAVLGVGNKPSDYDEEDVALVSFIVDLVWTIVVQKRADERIRELAGRLEQLAMTDELTGLANRRAFFATADRELRKSRRHASPLAFAMLDIDHFKEVNDLHGHDSGDAILKLVSRVVRSQVRDVDLPARLGGEEFGILLPDTRIEDAARSAERLRAAIAGASCLHRGVELRVTASLGVAALGDGQDLDALMRAADGAMYRAKAAGRNRVETA